MNVKQIAFIVDTYINYLPSIIWRNNLVQGLKLKEENNCTEVSY